MKALELLLVRHAEAEDGDPDAHRALTGAGRRRMRRTAELLAARAPYPDAMVTSPLVRAVQTAEILAGGFAFDAPIEVLPAVASPPSIRGLYRALREVGARAPRLVVVGHEPTLSSLALMLCPELVWSHFAKGQALGLRLPPGLDAAEFAYSVSPDGPRWIDAPADLGPKT